MTIRRQHLKMIWIYAPTDDTKVNINDTFFHTLSEQLNNVKNKKK